MFEEQTVFQPKFLIESLYYVTAEEYKPVYLRPYVISPKYEAVENIKEKLYETKMGKLTPSMVAQNVNNIVQPSAVGFMSPVDNDWVSQKRFIFILKVRYYDHGMTEKCLYISGFTNYDGITPDGSSIDFDLVHNINSVIETTRFTFNTPNGVVTQEKIAAIYNVIKNSYASGANLFTQRPKDVIDNINAYIYNKELFPDLQYYNMSNTLTPYNTTAICSTMQNNVPAEYITNLINMGISAKLNEKILTSSYEINTNDPIINIEPSLGTNEFVRYISRLQGFKTTVNHFHFKDLIAIDNTIVNRFVLVNVDRSFNMVNSLLSNVPRDGEYWQGQDPVTIKAYSIIEACVSLAVSTGFTKIFFNCNNMTNPYTNEITSIVTYYKSFLQVEETDMIALVELFKNKVINEVFIPESNNNTVQLNFDMYVDVFGTSRIFLSYAGFPGTWYTIPTFANSVFSPVVVLDNNTLENTIVQTSNLIETITPDLNSVKGIVPNAW